MSKEILMPKFHQHYSFDDVQGTEGMKIRGEEIGERFETIETEHQGRRRRRRRGYTQQRSTAHTESKASKVGGQGAEWQDTLSQITQGIVGQPRN